jgi:hypothetical protein
MTRLAQGLALGVFAAACVLWWHLFGSYAAWARPIHWVGAAGILGFAALALALGTRRAGWGIAIAVTLQSIECAIVTLALAGVNVLGIDVLQDRRLAVVIAVRMLAIWGLVRRRMWGLWLALAMAALGLVSSGLNLFNYWTPTAAPPAEYPEWTRQTYETAWAMSITSLGGALIVACLAAPATRAAFARNRDATWSSGGRLIGILRATITAAFAAMPMLLVYAWVQPIAPATQTTALVLAGALAVGCALAVRGKLAGAFVLVIAGLGLVAQTAFTVAGASDRSIAAYYAVFWLPAGALALAAGIALIRPTLRLLRR